MLKKELLILFGFLICYSCAVRKVTPPAIEPEIEVTRNLHGYKTLVISNFLSDDSVKFPHFETVMSANQIRETFGIKRNEVIKMEILSKALEAEGIDGQFLILELTLKKSWKDYWGVRLIEPFTSEILFSASTERLNGIRTAPEWTALRNALMKYISQNTNPKI